MKSLRLQPAATLAATCLALLSHGRTLRADADAVEAKVFEGHAEYVYMLSFSPDGKLLATGAGDNTAIIWDVAGRKPRHHLRHQATVYGSAFRGDGKVVATASGNGAVALWDVAEGRQLVAAKRHQDAVYCLDFSPDGQLLASAGGSTSGGDTVCRICRTADLQVVAEFSGHKRQVYGVAFSPDAKTVATGSSDKTIRVWNVADGKFREFQGHTSDVYRIGFSPDGKALASTGQDGAVRVWSIADGSSSLVHEGGKKNPVYAAAYTADGRRLAAVSDDGKLRIWRTDDWRLESETKVCRHALYCLGFLPGQRELAVGGEDGKIYLVSSPGESKQRPTPKAPSAPSP